MTRVLAAAAVPVLGTTLYFTLSRGGIGALIIGVIIYLVLGRPRFWASTAVATIPTTAVAAKVAYGAARLTSVDPTDAQRCTRDITSPWSSASAWSPRPACVRCASPRWIGWPRRCGSAAGREAWPTARLWWWAWSSSPPSWSGSHGRIAHEFHQFKQSKNTAANSSSRSRLTSVANDNRLPLWKVAWSEFKKKPVLGQGAGTYRNSWDQYGKASAGSVVNAHNLYLENLDELGIIGGVLLFGSLLLMLSAALSRVRGLAGPASRWRSR